MLHRQIAILLGIAVVGVGGPAFGQDAGPAPAPSPPKWVPVSPEPGPENPGPAPVSPEPAPVNPEPAPETVSSLPRGVLTRADELALEAQVRERVLRVRRRLPAGQFIVPGGVKPVMGAGWRAAPGRVVTATDLVKGWPLGEGDAVEVEVGGEWRGAAVGLYEAELGLAVLDVPGVDAPPGAAAPAVGAVFTGRPVYYLSPGGLQRARVGAAASGQQAYYIWLEGAALPPGTPVFDASARVVTLVGLPPPAAGRALVLPDRALRALFERANDWIP